MEEGIVESGAEWGQGVFVVLYRFVGLTDNKCERKITGSRSGRAL